MVTSPSLALWCINLSEPLSGLADWETRLTAKMREAKTAGAHLLVLPEYAVEQWLHFAPEGISPENEIAWLAQQGEMILPSLKNLVRAEGLDLLIGTVPATEGPSVYNRAMFLMADGQAIFQDKLCLTPSEQDPKAWHLTAGAVLRLFNWRGLRTAILTCLDIEMPHLAARMQGWDIDLLLVPSMTAYRSGYHRVFDCAKARAIELQCLVAVVGCVGGVRTAHRESVNCSGAAVFVPCEVRLGMTGTLYHIGPLDRAEGEGPILLAKDLPLAAIRASRHGQAEVWPGAWRADHVDVEFPRDPPQKIERGRT